MKVQEYLKTMPLIFDGAMGTYYAGLNSKVKKCELANINDQETILGIHREYLSAGCKAIKTNTFGANRISLESDFAMVTKVIADGYNLAMEAVKDAEAFVFADIGPIPSLEGLAVKQEYLAIIDVFLSLGATNFLFETFGSDEYLAELAEYIKEKSPQAFVLVSFAISPEGFTRLGLSGKRLFAKMAQVEAIDGVGFNCISGPFHLLQYIKDFKLGDKIVAIMPNAGYPTVIDNRTFFNTSTEYFAAHMLELAKLGVKILGGCCGTTPSFMQQTVHALESFSVADISRRNIITRPGKSKQLAPNLLVNKIKTGQKIIAVELDPPVDTDIDFFLQGAEKLQALGVDAVTIADCPIARARVDSSILACKLKRELGLTPIPHLTCRDRNINATKALLLGLNIEGINNVLVVTGDPIPTAERDEVKAMFSFNSAILASYITTLNETTFTNPFNIFGALNVNARNFDNQLIHAQKKIENGVSMFLTQPILTKEALDNLKKARKTLPAKILGGIIPIISYKNACFMDNEIPGIRVAPEIMDLYKGVTKEQAAELAIKISTQIAQEITPFVDGYYLITPFKRVEIISAIIENINHNSSSQFSIKALK